MTITENIIVENKPRSKGGRPKGSKTNGKNKMLAQLHKIWGDLKTNKPSEVISAASLYAELQGWKLKTPTINDQGEVMKIEFHQDNKAPVVKAIDHPPINKVIESVPVIKVEPIVQTETTTTTTPIKVVLEIK